MSLALLVSWAGAQTAEPTPEQRAEPVVAAPVEAPPQVIKSASGDFFYQLLLGELNAREGELSTGYALILDAAHKSANPQLYRRAVDIALQARAGDAALQATQAWIQVAPRDQDARRYLLQIFIALNRIAETAEPLKAALDLLDPADRAYAILAVPRGYARVTDKKLAAQVVEQALATYLTNPNTGAAAWTAVARMRLLAGEPSSALMAIQRAQMFEPQMQEAAMLALELMTLKLPQAQAQVKKYLDSSPQALPELRMGYARALIDAQRYPEAGMQLKIVTREKPDFAEAWLVWGALLLSDNQLANAKAVFLRFVELSGNQTRPAQFGRSLTQAYLSLAQIADKQKDFAAAEGWLRKIEDGQEMLQVQARRASILAQQGELAQARELIAQVPERGPKDARMKLVAELELLRERKQYQLAYDVLVKALVQFPLDPDLLYDQAMAAEKLNRLDEMERLLRQVMAVKPDHRHAYNALGYSLTQRNERLPEAKALIEKALEYSPTDPFVQDSLGWVEFRMGNTLQALKILQSAYKDKADAEIAAHLGEVLWSLGEREKALNMWREGVYLNPENETLLETLRRLGVQL